MAHSHAHSHAEPQNTYFLDQLCTIAVCGLLGFTAVMAYQTGMLQRINLIPEFHLPVMAAGSALLVMVVLRAIVIWKQAGRSQGAELALEVEQQTENGAHVHGEQCEHGHVHGQQCEHEHSHGHEHAHAHGQEHSHSHEHAHSHGQEHSHGHENAHSHGQEHSHGHEHAHSHGHANDKPSAAPQKEEEEHEDHDHGWSPWQYAVLIIPAVLFFLDLPAGGYNMTRLKNDLKDEALDPGTAARRQALASVAGGTVLGYYKKSGKPVNLKFSELQVHSSRESSRNFFEGRNVILVGQFAPVEGKDREFKLYRVKINCCGADAVTLKSRIVCLENIQGFNFEDWVRIEGEISFQRVSGRDEWIPVITVPSRENIHKIDKPTNLFDDV